MNGVRAAAAMMLASGMVAAWRPSAAPVRSAGPWAGVADTFPHARHDRMFTECEACHQGVAGGDSSTMFPSPDVCAPCHDGNIARRVDWQRHRPRATNLQFDHEAHPAVPCSSCHSPSDTSAFMEVGRARPDRCLPCHAPDADSHLTQTSCGPCHGTLTDARALVAADIAAFPKPPSHDSTWLFAHRRQAQSETCATCHAREFCASCHVNSRSVAAIQALATDQRVATLARGRRVTYRAPASHRASDFIRVHGLQAGASGASCGNCHARESCLTCHREEERVGPVAALARRVRGGARGVDLAGMRPPDHSPDFQLRHRTAAAGGDAVCSRCHASSFCASCHAGASAPAFHGTDFVARHSENAYTRENDCSACHQTETFCVSCHRTTGRARTGAPFGRFHDAQPSWLFGHGAAARRTIEACAACHQQRDCLRCHSPFSGWRVNPHGPGFDPSLADKNPAMCRQCHVTGIPHP